MARKIIAVIGGAQANKQALVMAERAGQLIAQKDAVLITGGLGGVMRAASKGAKQAGGLVMGILPGYSRRDANQYVDIPIVTGFGEARNVIIARTCDCALAIDGKYGTLSEIAFCLIFNKPVIGINTWNIDAPIRNAANAEEAIRIIFEEILQ